MPESWLDALDALRDHANTAHDDPEQLPALTDAAILHLTAMDDPANPGTPIVQTCASQEGTSVPQPPTLQTNATLSGRRLVLWFGHLAIEVFDPELGRTIFLEFNPQGFVQNFPYWGAVPVTDWIPSTPEEDKQLIQLWEEMQHKYKNGDFMWWNPILNCWVPVAEFFGAGLTYPPTSFPPGWNPSEHACMNCHAPEVKAWIRATPPQRHNWRWPPTQ